MLISTADITISIAVTIIQRRLLLFVNGAGESVLRDGRWSEQEASILVPGDIISIKFDDIVPVYAPLLEGDPLKIDQSAFTGESLPMNTNLYNEVFCESTCKQDEIEAVVIATGVHTFFGKAAHLVDSTNQVLGAGVFSFHHREREAGDLDKYCRDIHDFGGEQDDILPNHELLEKDMMNVTKFTNQRTNCKTDPIDQSFGMKSMTADNDGTVFLEQKSLPAETRMGMDDSPNQVDNHLVYVGDEMFSGRDPFTFQEPVSWLHPDFCVL